MNQAATKIKSETNVQQHEELSFFIQIYSPFRS